MAPILNYIIERAGDQTALADTGFCIGDFAGSELSEAYGCSAIPVRDNDHFFSVGIGISSLLLSPACPSVFNPFAPELVTFCALYGHCGGGPTVGMAMSGSLMACLAGINGMESATLGLSAAFA